jgi:hypothetical protein
MIHEAIIVGRDRKLRAADRLVLLVLAHRSIATNVVRQTLATLADETGLSRRGLIDALHRLRDVGLISIERDGRGNEYRLCLRELLHNGRQQQRYDAGDAPVRRQPVRRLHHSRACGAPDAPVARTRPRLVVVNNTRGTEP